MKNNPWKSIGVSTISTSHQPGYLAFRSHPNMFKIIQKLLVISMVLAIFLPSFFDWGLSNQVPDSLKINSAKADATSVVGPDATCDYYASTTGTSGGNGSSGSPWDLQTALNQTGTITSGKTLCLKGGTYTGRFISTISGTSGTNNQVTIRSAPGEWAKLDGNYTATLAAGIDATTRTLTFTDASGLREGQTVMIDTNENVQLGVKNGNTFTLCNRGWNSGHSTLTTGASHSIGAPTIPVDAVLEIDGSYTWVRDFEVTNSDTNRISVWQERGSGINTGAPGAHIINMVVHDTGHPGIGFWEGVGDGGVVYGSLIWGSGTYDNGGDWTRGSGIYTQNQIGTRYLTDNIWFRNFTEGIQIYTTNGYADGFDVEGNISFDNRASQNIWAGSSNVNPIQRLRIIDNYTYRRGASEDNSWDTRIGYTTNNTDAVLQNNYFVSNNVVFNPTAFSQLTFTGNTLVARNGLQMHFDQTGKTSYSIDNNHFYGSNQFTYVPNGPGGIIDFSQWKSGTGYDTSSTYSASLPADSYYVRPNSYQSGRANIAVYNWSQQNTVSVDLSSVLSNGDTYVIRDAQNYLGNPIAQGTYNGGSVSIPMNSTTIASVLGNITHITNINQHTSPEFGAFVLTSTPAGSPPAPSTVATPSISPSGGSYSSTQSVSLSTITSGASIRYTTDGSTPSSTVGTVYSSAFSVASTTTVKAIAYKTGSTDSSVASATFTITSAGGGGAGGGSGGGGTVTPPTTPPNTQPPTTQPPTTPPTTNSNYLIKNNNEYSLVQGGYRKGITSPGILYSCGFEFKDARTATSTDLTLPTSLLLPCGGSLVKSKEDKTVYLISSGQRHAFTSSAVFTGLGFKFTSVLTVTNPELQALPKSTDLSNASSAHLPDTDININGTIYWLDGNLVKHAYPSLEAYNSWHKDNDFTTVVPANSNDLNLTTGDMVTVREN